MQLESLYARDFRCISACDVALSPGINCIVGDNASGKTTLLESIYILGRGESFRQTRLTSAIRRPAAAFTLRTDIRYENNSRHRIGAHISTRQSRFKLDEQADVRRYDLVSALPLQHIDPNVHRLLEHGPKHRRYFLDWGVFHVEHAFFQAWRRYRRALKQRNRALRSNQPKPDIIVWDTELVQQGEIIDACRRSYLEHIKRRLPEATQKLIGDNNLSLDYQPGWRGNDGFGAALAQGLEQDLRAGFTQQGPHRADIRFTIASNQARDWVSRGQQKLLTVALLLTQADTLHELRGIRPVLLMDDMAAELGSMYRDVLAAEVVRIGAQCFLTFLSRDLIPASIRDTRVFHVEHGQVTAL